MAKEKVDTIKLLKKSFGEVFMNPNEVISRKRTIIPTTPKLDIQLSGGVATGSGVLIAGKPKGGKSILALQICANAQKEEYGGRHCYYLDAEGRLESKHLQGVQGLDMDKITVVKSTEDKILSGEDFLNIADKLIKSEPGCVIVIDSTSILCSASELDGDVSGDIRSKTPKMLGSFMRKIAGTLPINDCMVIMIQHVIANTGGGLWEPKQMIDSGNKISYGANTRLLLRSFKKWEDDGKQIGQLCNWYVEYSDLGPPGGVAEGCALRYGIGYDVAWDCIDLACELGFISKGGAWYTLDFMDEPKKMQGQKNVWEFLNTNKEEQDKLVNLIKGAF